MEGDMTLDTIVKFLIVLVVAGVVIGIFITTSNDAKYALSCLFFGCDENSTVQFPRTDKQPTFSPGQVANYIESCYDNMVKAPETSQKEAVICYILMADSPFKGFVTSEDVIGEVDPRIRSSLVINTTFEQAYLQVKFLEFIKDSNGTLVSNRVVIE